MEEEKIYVELEKKFSENLDNMLDKPNFDLENSQEVKKILLGEVDNPEVVQEVCDTIDAIAEKQASLQKAHDNGKTTTQWLDAELKKLFKDLPDDEKETELLKVKETILQTNQQFIEQLQNLNQQNNE